MSNLQDLGIYPGALTDREYQELYYRQTLLHEIDHLPQYADLGQMPIVIRHQHKLPVCTGEAGANLRAILHYQQYGQILNFSGMFIYKMNRLYYDGLKAKTIGSTLKATMLTLKMRGVCLEESYATNHQTLVAPFPTRKYGAYLLAEAENYGIDDFARLGDLDDILLALAQDLPVIFSLIIFTDFYEANKGVVASQINGRKIGGHSMVAVGYDLDSELVRVVQSWGKDEQGPTDCGYMYIPFAWFKAKLADGTPFLIEAYVPL